MRAERAFFFGGGEWPVLGGRLPPPPLRIPWHCIKQTFVTLIILITSKGVLSVFFLVQEQKHKNKIYSKTKRHDKPYEKHLPLTQHAQHLSLCDLKMTLVLPNLEGFDCTDNFKSIIFIPK